MVNFGIFKIMGVQEEKHGGVERISLCVFRVNYPEEASTFVNGPNMQKSKLLIEPKQKTNSKEKKEKIKSTISQKQNWKQIFCKIQEL